jgi:hypothetical protein
VLSAPAEWRPKQRWAVPDTLTTTVYRSAPVNYIKDTPNQAS